MGVFGNWSHVLGLARHVGNNWRPGLETLYKYVCSCFIVIVSKMPEVSWNAVLVGTCGNNCSRWYISHQMTVHTMKCSHKREEPTKLISNSLSENGIL